MNTQKQIKQLEKTLKDTAEQLKNMEIEIWELKRGEGYYHISDHGDCGTAVYDNSYFDDYYLATGNYFQIKKGAEMHKLRLESMKRGFMPKVGEEYWTIGVDGECVVLSIWSKEPVDFNRYNLGRTFKTGKDAGSWIEKYAAAWKFVEGENG